MSRRRRNTLDLQPPREEKFKLNVGDQVWIPDEQECFALGTLKQVNKDGTLDVTDKEGKKKTLKKKQVCPVNPSNMDGVPDNTQLMHLQDPSLLHNIRHRYAEDNIYTYTAYILIAINPYKQLPIYSEKAIKDYFGKSFGANPPHVFAVADRAYKNMKYTGKSQSVIVSGESGAGKTETCKFVMRFYATIAGSGQLDKLDQLENKILEANPVLEAFGNAKTLRNNNSSRFGKFTELHFDSNHQVTGASVVTYLLEKSRLVRQAPGERNFHVFFQMVAGANAEEKTRYKLSGSANDFWYISNSGCTTVKGVDDAQEFSRLKKALLYVGLQEENQQILFRTLSGLLHLGNVKFAPAPVKTELKDASTISEDYVIVAETCKESLKIAAEMLGLDAEKLQQTLVTRTIVVGNRGPSSENTYTIQLSDQQATNSRDALAKKIYGSLFDWIVSSINKNIPRGASNTFIGILDISGFELFEHNSFEQLCINFANEKIQQYFNQQILNQEQELYLQEGLQWRTVEFDDNQEMIELIEAKGSGIFSILNEQSMLPKATDKTFCTKIHAVHSANKHLDIPKYTKKMKVAHRLGRDEGFVVSHFAGKVLYNTEGFLDKNNDSLHHDLQSVLYSSENVLLREFFPPGEDGISVGPTNRKFKSISAQFLQQLEKLMKDLHSTESHFIRCIKPNQEQVPGKLDGIGVMQQLRYNGMCTALELMSEGFPTRIPFDDLYERYSKRMPEAIAKLRPQTFCEALLVALDLVGGADFQMGLTRAFFRAGKLQLLDELTSNSEDDIQKVVKKVQKWLIRKRWRGAVASVKAVIQLSQQIETIKRLKKMRETFRVMIKVVRCWVPRVHYARKTLMESAAYKEKLKKEKEEEERARLALLRQQEEEERIRKEAWEAAEAERKRQEEEELRQRREAKEKEEQSLNLQEELKKRDEEIALLRAQLEDAEEEIKELKHQLKKVEESDLVKSSIEASETTRKLKVVESRFADKPDQFLRLVHGDLSFNTMASVATKYALVQKQGGENMNKWQERHLLLVDDYILYYAKPADRTPKGIVRLGPEIATTFRAAIRIPSTNELKPNTFGVLTPSNRTYYFSTASEEECDAWLRELLAIQEWGEQEIEDYIKSQERNQSEEVPQPEFRNPERKSVFFQIGSKFASFLESISKKEDAQPDQQGWTD